MLKIDVLVCSKAEILMLCIINLLLIEVLLVALFFDIWDLIDGNLSVIYICVCVCVMYRAKMQR